MPDCPCIRVQARYGSWSYRNAETDFLSVLAAAVMQGVTGSVLGPGIAAIRLVGHGALVNVSGKSSSRLALLRDRRLLIFAICLFLFQLANASLLPLLGEALAYGEGHRSSLVVSALVVLPRLIVALLAPWAGRTANSWGRRPLLLAGLGVVPIRSGLFAFTSDPTLLVLIQMLGWLDCRDDGSAEDPGGRGHHEKRAGSTSLRVSSELFPALGLL